MEIGQVAVAVQNHHATPDCPDSFVYHPDRWPPCCVSPIEWKSGPKAARTPEQEELEELGVIGIAFDTPSLFTAIYRFERADGRIKLHPRLRAWAEELRL